MLLSIITVNLNNLAGLKKTAESIINQTCKDYEWIVIDGGSTDGSKEYIESISDHITYWVSEPDSGIYNAMNKGVAVAKGDYLNFLNSGDRYKADTVIKDLKSCKLTEDFIYGNTEYVDNFQKIVSTQTPNEKITLSDFIESNICQQSILYSKRCFVNNRFNESYKICADYEMNIKLFMHCFSFRKVDMVISQFSMDGISFKKTSLSKMETHTCLTSSMPITLYREYTNYNNYFKSDIGSKTYEIINSNRFYRYFLRIFLYPIHFIALKTKKINV